MDRDRLILQALTKPTRGRLALWLVLAGLWFMFLPQELAMDPHLRHFSVLGAALWAGVLAWLVAFAVITRRRRRRTHHAGPPTSR